MDKRLVALDRYLDELGVTREITTLRDRKRVQKAVYLGQAAGADLGYRFSWYILGPYSPALTRDYFSLAEEGDVKTELQLHPELRRRLAGVRPLINEHPVDPVELSLEDWLELCASIHYQVSVLGRDREQTRAYLDEHSAKHRLVRHFDEAWDALARVDLLPE